MSRQPTADQQRTVQQASWGYLPGTRGEDGVFDYEDIAENYLAEGSRSIRY